MPPLERLKSLQRQSGKVTLVEMLWVTLLIAGSLIGFHLGYYAHLGIWGSILGLLSGIMIALLVSSVIAFFINKFIRKD